MNFQDQFKACIIGGAIGDAWGSSYENEILVNDSEIYYWGKKPSKLRKWQITDDTQLTLATCETLAKGKFHPEALLNTFVDYYKNNKLTGVGASTLKAILDKESGYHWSQCGRTSEFAAGNGGAMRIAPFAFFENITREDIFNACKITHRNDEAFVGALAVYSSLKAILNFNWIGNNNLFDFIIPELPDTNVRDRLIKINELGPNVQISEIAKLGNNGYVVNSIPFAIFCSTKVLDLGLEEMFQQIINSGGDTDTNASIAGQIAGALIGYKNISQELITKLKNLKEYSWIEKIIDETKLMIS
ncbi:ADP-ribosylglycohydrolase family protein [Chryseobacterium sp. Y16C]|uniref:ADP-ribosylglycohydrolase family protein n=1 Tax=Chryseobacterium sp. Y16C TaxID=2920939 RepID=UPI001F0A2A04|nr:ADP-ribosylglycohydrolase family protein [Chryseobacterium sp. Y16C]UMQ42741.1 ADP-ribosylglycohydrolase family protein [Chryseobacterium sp. Y16C]